MAEEDWEDYVEGGYHPVSIGDNFANGKYTVVRKLGWGHFSTVWLAKDSLRSKHVALKVVKSAERYTETALDEIKLLQRLNTADLHHPGRNFVVSLLDSFRHQGPNGIHVCMVFEVLGENLLGLIRRYRDRTIPVPLVRQIAAQILVGLEYMHDKCGIIHTDLKPENVLLWIDDVEAVVATELAKSSSAPNLVGAPPSRGRGGNQTPRTNSIAIMDSQPLPSPTSSASSMQDKWGLTMSSISDAASPHPIHNSIYGSAKAPDSPNTDVIVKVMESVRIESPIGKKSRPTQPPMSGPSLLSQQAPSSVSSSPPASSAESINRQGTPHRMQDPEDENFDHVRVIIADFGNATWAHHHFTDDIQTRQYRSPEVILGAPWGASADLWSAACVIFELLSGGDYLFDPASASRYSKDDDHLAQIIELLGQLPKDLYQDSKHRKDFFDDTGKLLRIHKLRQWPLHAVLSEKYLFLAEESSLISSFLLPMLHLDPSKRVPPSKLRRHPWLRGVRLPIAK